jgi:UDP-N-acetyl-D-glucosamine dehydrogenase
VHAVDPHVEPSRADSRIGLVDLTAEELTAAHAVVVLTDHDVFDWDLVRKHAAFIFDTRHRLDGTNVEHL